jgi:spermidine/putrescine transport system ATP-binding protein
MGGAVDAPAQKGLIGMSQSKDPIVRLEHVTKRFDRVEAVKALDVEISRGQFVTLLGPSGCGKSTTLRMIGGFETPTEGRILIAGEDVTRLPPNKRDVNMVFQDYALFPHMTVHGNIAFGLELKGLSRAAVAERVGELLDLVQLQSFEERMPDQLSGGQRQRVALARALAPDPKVLLLDEPLGALDAKLRGQVQIELKAIQQRTGKTFVFVTHDQEEALTMSDRILVMNAGRVEQDGTPGELYQRPKSRFVADFIGETNFLRCTVKGAENGWLVLDWNGLAVRAGYAAHSAGAAVEAALRPESIVCAPARPDLPNSFEARIVRQVFKGSRASLHLELAGGSTLEADADPYLLEHLADNRLWVGWQPDRVAVLLA